jgi:hypothetical protein
MLLWITFCVFCICAVSVIGYLPVDAARKNKEMNWIKWWYINPLLKLSFGY